MTYADAFERSDLIAGLRALADFLTEHPDVPAPRWTDVMVFPDGSDAEIRAEVDDIAMRIGTATADATSCGGHYTTSRSFGPVEYKAVAIPADRRANTQRRSENQRHPRSSFSQWLRPLAASQSVAYCSSS
jgi:hypothetical protein